MPFEDDLKTIVGLELSGNWVKSVPEAWPSISVKTTTEFRRVARELRRWFPPRHECLDFFCLDDPGNLVEGAVNDLKERGLHVFPFRLSDDAVDSIAAHLRSRPHRIKSSGRRVRDLSGPRINSRGGQTRWIDDLQHVIETPHVLDIAGDRVILSTVRSYLGVEPVLMQANSWWTVTGSALHRNPDEDAQLFHQDNEFLSFLKVFVYLTDVSAANGPHRIVIGSHQDFEQELGPDHAPSSRLSEADVLQHYDESRIKAVEGRKGTIFIADTTCLHAGSPVTDGYRGVLQLEYASSPYLSQIQPFARNKIEGTPFSRVFGRESRLAINFRDDDYGVWLQTRDPRFAEAAKNRLSPYRHFVGRTLRRTLALGRRRNRLD